MGGFASSRLRWANEGEKLGLTGFVATLSGFRRIHCSYDGLIVKSMNTWEVKMNKKEREETIVEFLVGLEMA